MRLAVVGHVEWVEFLRVESVPAPGAIAQATESFEEAAGGGAVAAVQLARLGGGAELFTALGSDKTGARSRERIGSLRVGVRAASREEPTRRAVTFLDGAGERTITVLGPRLHPKRADELEWQWLDAADGVYFTAGDAGALQAARQARVLVATPRAGDVLSEAGVDLDALVYSADDALEAATAERLQPRPSLLVATRGATGGSFVSGDEHGEWPPAEIPGPVEDSYGCGDSFAAALCFGLATGLDTTDALALAARAGATCLAGRGPYGRQLAARDL
ncbi:MAG: PfkB family carbohydrate kinase [Solirubrobacterales bacterium]